jgi:NADH dehydrogenase/NADH:ubiquinone oxidoreductase subunit G
MDGLGANIDVHTRGSDVLRILPRVNEEVNEEWISDKARHSFDGLRKQRLHVPLLR